VERRLAAILAADVVGYSKLMAKDEAGTLVALKAHREELFDPETEKRGGRIVKLMGDGVLVEFPSVVDAVECAIAIQNALANDNSGPINLRIGINLGDVIVEGDDLYGDGVNIAARLEALAEPGGVCISDLVHRSIRAKTDATFNDIGEQNLKNIEEGVRVWQWQPTLCTLVSPEAASVQAQDMELPEKPSIAVLPFNNMSGDPEQEYFSDGITEDIITELARFSSLFVIARNSSFHFKGTSPKVQDVGRELGVEYVVEGSVRKAGNRIRVTAQLVEATTGNHVWAERYDRDLEDVFAVQDELVQEIAASIPGHLDAAAIERVRQKPAENLKAYEYVLRGDHMRNQDWASAEAIPLFEKAIEADPQCARAYAQIANWHAYSILAHCAPLQEAIQKTRDLGTKALELSPRNIDVLGVMSEAYLMTGDLELARQCINKAIKLNPNHYAVMVYAAIVLAWAGDVDESLQWRDLYLRYDPMHGPALAEVEFEVLLLAERYEEAIHALAGWHDLPIHLLEKLVAAHALAGKLDEAKALAAQFVSKLTEGHTVKDHVSRTLRMCSHQEQRDILLEGYRKAGFDL
jgi:TolB-like protein/class 3 adenylate cyclase